MKKLILAFICLFFAVPSQARTITVDDHGPADFDNIQAAINDSNNGDIIIISPGTYTGPGNRNIDFDGKAITVRSTDPNDPNVVAATTINCQGNGRGFNFHSGEGPGSIVSGLTIKNGHVPRDQSSGGGGIYCTNSSPTISLCSIKGNTVEVFNLGGSGIFCNNSSPTISHCTITGNSASEWTYGGGIYCRNGSDAVISHCTIADNFARSGGGIASKSSNPTVSNCIITGNSVIHDGGGIHCNESTPTISHCTITDNSSDNTGGGVRVRNSPSIISHCIIWDNSAYLYDNELEISGARPTILYSDVRGGYSGEGNFDADPCFVNPAGGDYHLSDYSPCINAGDPNYIGEGKTDIDGEPRVINNRVDIGADEFNYITAIIDVSPASLVLEANEGDLNPQAQILSISNLGTGTMNWEVTEDCSWLQVAPNNGDCTGETDDVNVNVDISGMDWGTYNCVLTITSNEAVNSPLTVTVTLIIYGDFEGALHVPMEYPTIQAAINDANDGDIVIVGDGTYTGDGNRDINFGGKAITVRSENGPANCIIDCQGNSGDHHRGFIFNSGEGADSVLCGFTITGGFVTDSYQGGAGVLCSNASPKITNCIFRGNSAILGGGGLCYIYSSSPEITNCTFHNNSVEYGQGGAVGGESFMEATMSNCIIWGNIPTDDSGISIQPVPYCDGAGCGPYPITVNFSALQNNRQSQGYIDAYGTIVADPCFADANNGDYHLRSQAGRWDPNTNSWVIDAATSLCIDAGDPNSDWTAELWPHGKRINMGAFGGTLQASMSLASAGNKADLNNNDDVNFRDFSHIANRWQVEEVLLAEDLNRNGVVDFNDLAIFADNWLW